MIETYWFMLGAASSFLLMLIIFWFNERAAKGWRVDPRLLQEGIKDIFMKEYGDSND